MKRYIRAALTAALLAPVLWTAARAQDDAAPTPPPHEQARQPRGDGMATRMKERLGLTDEQSAKFEEALKAHGAAMKQQGEQMKDGVKKLAEDVKANAKDEEILSALAALKTMRKAMAEENEKFEESLASILTPTQRAKRVVGMAMMMRDRREGGMRRKKGGDADGGRHPGADRDDGDHGDAGHDGPQGGDAQ